MLFMVSRFAFNLPFVEFAIQYFECLAGTTHQSLALSTTLGGVDFVIDLGFPAIVVVCVALAERLPFYKCRRAHCVRHQAALLHVLNKFPVNGVVDGLEATNLVECSSGAALRHGVAVTDTVSIR